jgi:adenine-specific DNA-methyltransferase
MEQCRHGSIHLCEACSLSLANHWTHDFFELNPSLIRKDVPKIEPVCNTYLVTHTMSSRKKNLGQYFTLSDTLQQFVFDNVKHKSSLLLEPSFGAGHLLKKFKEFNENYPILCYELDDKIKPIINFNQYQTPVYGDFTKQLLTQKFKTIVGNPPYVKQSGGNLYIQFVELCYKCLEEDGELLFIVPSDFLKLTSASSILDTMTQTGSFTHFFFPNNEKLFEGASIDVVVFRYEKGLKTNKTLVNGKEMFCNVNKGIITFSDLEVVGSPLDSLFHVYVGLVSGKDEVYRVPFGNIQVLNDKNKLETYIYTETYPTKTPEIDAHLLTHKAALLSRKIKKFSESNWFEWGAPRNISSMKKYWDRPCIYVKNMTRSKEVAFLGKVQYFGGTLLCLVPKIQMTDAELTKMIDYMNTSSFQKDYMYAGRFKIGHKQISTAILPT